MVTFGGYIGKYNMSKFLTLCEKIEKLLNEEGEQQVNPGEPVVGADNQVIDPQAAGTSEIQEVSNDALEKLVQTLVDFYQNGKTLTADQVERIKKEVPTSINNENSDQAVETLMSIFNDASFPEDTSGDVK